MRKYLPLISVVLLFVVMVCVGANAYKQAQKPIPININELEEVPVAFTSESAYFYYKKGFDDWSKPFLALFGFCLAKLGNGRKKK